jgi:predicted PurR-regulated permease PerM
MNRIQFFVLTGLSSLLLILLVGHIFIVYEANLAQNRLALAQQMVNQAQTAQANLKQLAVRIYQDSQKSNDQGLKDILTRQQITYSSGPATDGTAPPAPTPAPAPAATH